MMDPSLYVPFADPSFAPDWVAGDRPDWPNDPRDAQEARFRAYCLSQLNELEKRAVPTPDGDSEAIEAWAKLSGAMLPALRAIKSDFEANPPPLWRATGLDPKDLDRHQRIQIERRRKEAAGERSQPGKIANAPGSKDEHPSWLAAEEMAKLRFVIFPRLWSSEERDKTAITNEELARLAAARFPGVNHSAVLSRWSKLKLATRFKEASSNQSNK
jgi:hypothetical protein